MAVKWKHKFTATHQPGMKNQYPYTEAHISDSTTLPVVTYWVWHVQKQKKVRKRIILRGRSTEDKLREGRQLVKDLNKLLADGWHIDEGNEATATEIQQAVSPVLPPPDTNNTLPKTISLGDAYTYYSRAKGRDLRDDTTMPLYDGYIAQLQKWLRTQQDRSWLLRELTPTLAHQFLDQAPQGGRYRNNMRGFLKSFYRFFIKREILTKNPFEDVENARVDDSDDHRPFTREQATQIREAILADGDAQLWLFIEFAYFLFIRPGKELRLLRVGDIGQDKVKVISGHGKNRKTGYVDIPRALEASIQRARLRDYPPHYYVFTINQKPGLTPVGINYFYKRHVKYLKALDLFGFDYDVYSWKPTGVIALYEHTRDLVRVQRHCRHSTPDQTYTYLRKYGIVFAGMDLTDFPAVWDT
jgi:site-specific recombinase XerD